MEGFGLERTFKINHPAPTPCCRQGTPSAIPGFPSSLALMYTRNSDKAETLDRNMCEPELGTLSYLGALQGDGLTPGDIPASPSYPRSAPNFREQLPPTDTSLFLGSGGALGSFVEENNAGCLLTKVGCGKAESCLHSSTTLKHKALYLPVNTPSWILLLCI